MPIFSRSPDRLQVGSRGSGRGLQGRGRRRDHRRDRPNRSRGLRGQGLLSIAAQLLPGEILQLKL